MSNLIREKYAKLLVNYCLAVKKNDKVYVSSTYLAEPLLREVAKEIYIAGGIPVLNVELHGVNDLALQFGNEEQLAWVNPLRKYVMENFDCYLNIRAPFEKGDDEKEAADAARFKTHARIIGTGLRWILAQTSAHTSIAGALKINLVYFLLCLLMNFKACCIGCFFFVIAFFERCANI